MVYWRVAVIKIRPNPSESVVEASGWLRLWSGKDFLSGSGAIKPRSPARHRRSLDLSQYANCSLPNRFGLFRFHGGHLAEDRRAPPALPWLQDIHSGSAGHQNGATRREMPVQAPAEAAFANLSWSNRNM